jgi:hypothetical protein
VALILNGEKVSTCTIDREEKEALYIAPTNSTTLELFIDIWHVI